MLAVERRFDIKVTKVSVSGRQESQDKPQCSAVLVLQPAAKLGDELVASTRPSLTAPQRSIPKESLERECVDFSTATMAPTPLELSVFLNPLVPESLAHNTRVSRIPSPVYYHHHHDTTLAGQTPRL